MLVAADLQRPAAVEQLKVIGTQVGVPVFSQADSNPVAVCQQALVEANRSGLRYPDSRHGRPAARR